MGLPMPDKLPENRADQVLAAFRRKPKMCLHQIGEITGLTRGIVRMAVIDLQKRGDIMLLPEVAGDRVYQLINDDLLDSTNNGTQRIPELFGLSEDVAVSRVMLLKRFRDRLHPELHHTLNLIIGDYERGLKALEILREGEDDEAVKKEIGK
jgi:hypothetical protein